MKKRNSSKSIIIKVILILVTIIISILLLTLPMFKVKDIEVKGNSSLSSVEVIQKTKFQKNRNIFLQRYLKSIYELKHVKEIKDFKISLKLPNKVVININERTAKYQVSTSNGYYIIDDQGYILKKSDEKTKLIMLSGFKTKYFENIDRLNIEDLYILDGINNIYINAKEKDLIDLITEIRYTNKEYILNFEKENKIAKINSPVQDLIAQFTMIKKIIEDRPGAAGEIFLDKNEKRTYMIFREKI